jgi:AhpD family alkylhydroperoxidase
MSRRPRLVLFGNPRDTRLSKEDYAMQRYKLTDYENASPETRAVYDDLMRSMGETSPPVWIKSMGHSPALARAYWEKAKGTLFGGRVPLPLKEMIVFAVSGQNGAKYCTACHAKAVLKLDRTLTFEDLQSFLRGDPKFELPESYRTAVKFASKVISDPNGVTDEDFEVLRDDGFSSEEIYEIIAVIDMAAMFNIYTCTLRLHLDPNYRAVL